MNVSFILKRRGLEIRKIAFKKPFVRCNYVIRIKLIILFVSPSLLLKATL